MTISPYVPTLNRTSIFSIFILEILIFVFKKLFFVFRITIKRNLSSFVNFISYCSLKTLIIFYHGNMKSPMKRFIGKRARQDTHGLIILLTPRRKSWRIVGSTLLFICNWSEMRIITICQQFTTENKVFKVLYLVSWFEKKHLPCSID